MRMQRTTTRSHAFTLIELMVVIAIIGILVAVLIPALAVARRKAREAAVKAQVSSLANALEVYRGEGALGGDYPPSQTDNNTGDEDSRKITDPFGVSGNLDTVVAGAHLLVHAMLGADLLGPPGFFDFNREDNDHIWANDTHSGVNGAYELDKTTGKTMRPRYGYGASGFVSDDLRQKATTLKELKQRGGIDSDDIDTEQTKDQYLFVDAFDRPILYYRANPSATLMTGSGKGQKAEPGVFSQEDNGIITGSLGVGAPYNHKGVDFGAGPIEGDSKNVLHALRRVKYPEALPQPDNPKSDLNHTAFDNTFERFIWDPTVKQRNTPVNRDTFLLITAGPDTRYGTNDDITNWARDNR